MLLDVQGEAIRWEREGMSGGTWGRSRSVPLVSGIQYGVRGRSGLNCGDQSSS